MKKEEMDGKSKLRAASFSLYVNIFLIIIKFAVMLMTGSLAILAELLHSFFDMLASLFAYAGIRKASEPEDGTHMYGHEKFENLSSLAQTVLIVITSILIIGEGGIRIINFLQGKPIEALKSTELGLAVMVITIVIDYLLSRFLHSSSRKYESAALEADAYHFTTDLWGAVAVIVGLLFVMLGFPVFDSIAAIFVAILMLYVSYKLGKKAIYVLMDTSPHKSVMEKIKTAICSVKEVESFHKLRVRQAGNKIFVDVHIQVAPEMTVEQGHYVAHEVKARLMKELSNVKEVTVHVEPKVESFRKKI